MLKKIKSFLLKDITFFDKINLKKKYPNYFNLKIFRLFWLLLLVLLLMDLNLNGWEFQTISLTCDSGKVYCDNPFYVCPELTVNAECLNERPSDLICSTGLCDLPTLPPGFTYGRQDLLAKHGSFIFVFIIPGLAFFFNHINFLLKRRFNK